MGVEGTYFNIIKAIYDIPTAKIILNGKKKNESISSKIRNKTRVSSLTAIIQHSSRIPSYGNQRRKRHKINSDDAIHRKPYKCYQQILQLISELSEITGYKISIQKSFAFLYTNNENSE